MTEHDKLIEDFKKLAHYYISLYDGEDFYTEMAWKLIQKYNLVDEFGEQIYEEGGDGRE